MVDRFCANFMLEARILGDSTIFVPEGAIQQSAQNPVLYDCIYAPVTREVNSALVHCVVNLVVQGLNRLRINESVLSSHAVLFYLEVAKSHDFMLWPNKDDCSYFKKLPRIASLRKIAEGYVDTNAQKKPFNPMTTAMDA
jgi:hypothetical protein